MPIIPPGNIWSDDPERAVFTNPTCIAKWKGRIKGDYPVTFQGQWYKDAETAYQVLAKDQKGDVQFCYDLCTNIVEAKLRQHPVIFQAIKENGGLDWIKQCSHWVFARKLKPNRWEGDGLASGFIRCLFEAYRRIEDDYKVWNNPPIQ